MRLFINNIEIDLKSDTQIALTKQSANLEELGTRQTTFSSRFSIPPTPANMKTFGYLGTPGNPSQLPYSKVTARLESDSGFVIAKDLMMKVALRSTDGIEVNLFGTEYDFNKTMKEARFRDLMDLIPGGGIHQYDVDYFIDSQQYTNGVIYPLISQLWAFPGNSTIPSDRLYIDLAYPAAYTKDLFVALLEKYFPYYTSNALMHPVFQRDVIVAAYTQSDYWKEFERSTMRLEGAAYITLKYWFDTWDIQKNDKGWLTTPAIITDPSTVYRVKANRKLTISINYQVDVTTLNGNDSDYLAFRVREKPDAGNPDIENDELIAEHIIVNGDNHEIISGVFSGEGNLEIEAKEGKEYYITIEATVVLSNGTIDFLDVEFVPSAQLLYGDNNINTKYLLPDYTEALLMDETCKRFGLVYEIQNDGSIRLESFKDIFSGAFGYDDWTQKTTGKDSDAFTASSMGKRSYFQYNGDRSPAKPDGTPDLNVWNGWWMEQLNNFFYDDEKVVIESKGDAKVCDYRSNIFVLNVEDSELSETNFLTLGSNDKLIYASSYIDDIFVKYDLFRRQFPDDPQVGILNDTDKRNFLAWADWLTLTNEFYGDVITSLSQPVVKTINIYLTEEEYYNLDIFKPKYFEQFQAYFYLLKIENYLPGYAAKATFLQIKRK